MPGQPDPLEAEARARGTSVEALRAFYAHRNASLTNSHTTARQGALTTQQKPPAPPAPRRTPGILGYVLDSWRNATGD
jgi:hypothetical protein